MNFFSHSPIDNAYYLIFIRFIHYNNTQQRNIDKNKEVYNQQKNQTLITKSGSDKIILKVINNIFFN